MSLEQAQLNFKKNKSNSINIIDFESTLGSKNLSVFGHLEKNSWDFLRNENAKFKRDGKLSNNSNTQKYIDKDSNSNYFSSTRFSQNDNFSGKTNKESNINFESNRQTFIVHEEENKEKSRNETENEQNKNSQNSSLIFDHFQPNKIEIKNIKAPLQLRKAKLNQINLNFGEKRNKSCSKINRIQLFSNILCNDVKVLLDFRKSMTKNNIFIPNLKYPYLHVESDEVAMNNKKKNGSLLKDRSLLPIHKIIDKTTENNYLLTFCNWKKVLQKKIQEKERK